VNDIKLEEHTVSVLARSDFLQAPSTRRLAAGDLEAVFLPERGMLGASLQYRGIEMLRRVDDLAGSAAKGSTAGIPLLHPWANRLAGCRYRAVGKDVVLDPSSPLLHLDGHGLPMHGVPWSRVAWEVSDATPRRLAAFLDWTHPEWLAIFPFPHRLEITATLDAQGLRMDTTLLADARGPVPVSFGFHPYIGIADVPRSEWRLTLPAMRHLRLDAHGIPTGETERFEPFDRHLADRAFDDGFALEGESASFSLTGGGLSIRVDFIAGYRYAQVFAPPGDEFIALEPMTAPTSALTHGRGLEIVPAGGRFHATFRASVASAA
jgi:aldose 1-epimerase